MGVGAKRAAGSSVENDTGDNEDKLLAVRSISVVLAPSLSLEEAKYETPMKQD